MTPEVARRIEEHTRRDGSINVGCGPSGCGKTDCMLRCSLAAAYIFGLEWYAYDSNGDVRVHLNGILAYHTKRHREASDPKERDRHLRKILFLRKCINVGLYSGPENLSRIQNKVLQMVAEGIVEAKSTKKRKARAIVFIDEAGAVRDADDRFWPSMRQARNAGVTIYTTGHRVKDWHPAARANIRALCLWKPSTEKFYDINGTKVPRDLCAEAKGPKVHVFLPGDLSRPIVWDREASPEVYPPEIIVPAQPTVARDAGF